MKLKLLLAIVFLGVACSTSTPPPAQEPDIVPAPTGSSPSATMYVSAATLNVRSEPSTQSKVVTQVRRGERLTVLSGAPAPTPAWVYVETASGARGWVAAQHVSSSPAGTASSKRRRPGCPPDSDYRFVKTPTPSFSDSGAHGLVVVEANVDASGTVRTTRVISNDTGDEGLAAVAQREIREARFAAPVRDCAPSAFIFTYKRSF